MTLTCQDSKILLDYAVSRQSTVDMGYRIRKMFGPTLFRSSDLSCIHNPQTFAKIYVDERVEGIGCLYRWGCIRHAWSGTSFRVLYFSFPPAASIAMLSTPLPQSTNDATISKTCLSWLLLSMCFQWIWYFCGHSLRFIQVCKICTCCNFHSVKPVGDRVVKYLTDMQTRYVEYEWEYVFMAGVLSLQTNNECLTAAWNASYSLCAILCVELLVELQKHLIKLSRLHFWRFSFAGKKEEDTLLLAEEREAAPVREVELAYFRSSFGQYYAENFGGKLSSSAVGDRKSYFDW